MNSILECTCSKDKHRNPRSLYLSLDTPYAGVVLEQRHADLAAHVLPEESNDYPARLPKDHAAVFHTCVYVETHGAG